MGEGTRKPGDRDDISSDDEDEMERARASWPRAPLKGAALIIARLWLDKARKRRAFTRHIQGLMLAQKKDACDLTGRTEAMGAKLVCTLATNGRPDKNAIDDLIAGFEEAYGPNERDVNLWKAYFRGHAEFITVDQAILDANERERVARQSQRPPGAGRATRADDVSSDSEEEDCAFDPLVVVRTSSEGRMLSKWLDAARKRLGGTFPRDAARAEMEAYAEKMRRRKLKGGKQAVAGVVEDETTEAARLEKRVVRLSQVRLAASFFPPRRRGAVRHRRGAVRRRRGPSPCYNRAGVDRAREEVAPRGAGFDPSEVSRAGQEVEGRLRGMFRRDARGGRVVLRRRFEI